MQTTYIFRPGAGSVGCLQKATVCCSALILLFAGMMYTAQYAHAQTAEQPAPSEEDGGIEEVVVTGSRIVRSEYNLTQPMQVVDSETTYLRGFQNISETLNELPSFGIAGNNLVGAQGELKNRDGEPVGHQLINLFGLGSQRTLTIINGKRVVSQAVPTFSQGGQQVDLNIIPSLLIDRVEVLTTGGGPIYGSDAIAGTVNVILRDDFTGAELDVQSGITDRGDGEIMQVAAALGSQLSGGQGNVAVHFEYTDISGIAPYIPSRSDIFSGSRFVGRIAGESPFVPDGYTLGLCPADCDNFFFFSNGGLPLSTNDPSLPIAGLNTIQDSNGTSLQFAPDGSLVPFDLGLRVANIYSFGGDGPREFLNVTLLPDQERFNFFGKADYELADGIELYAWSLVSKSETIEPISQPDNNSLFPFEEAPLPMRLGNPFLSDSARQIIEQNLPVDGSGNLVNQFDIDGDGIPDEPGFFLNRFHTDVHRNAPRTFEQLVYNTRVGVRGEWNALDRSLNWDLSYNFGRTETSVRALAIINPKFSDALDAIQIDQAQADAITSALSDFGQQPLSAGDIVCRNKLDAALNGLPRLSGGLVSDQYIREQIVKCVPLDIFGSGAPSEEAIDFVTANVGNEADLQQHDVVGSVTTELFEMPWNSAPVSVALGFEHRREQGVVMPQGSNLLGLTKLDEIQPSGGDFDVTEFFGEFLIPLVTTEMDIPFVEGVELEGAARQVSNSLSGDDWTWTGGLKWRIDDNVMFRGNFTRSIRAPAINEAFAPQQGIRQGIDDPCEIDNIDTGPAPATRRQNCEQLFNEFVNAHIAEFGVPFDADPAIPGLQTGLDAYQVFSATRAFSREGNPNLNNEKAESFTVGVIVSPSFAPGLQLAVDWVDIALEDVIFIVEASTLAATCFDDPNFERFCNRVQRGIDFQPINAQETWENIGFRNFKALLVNAEYTGSFGDFGLDGWGDFRIALNYQNLDTLETSITGTGLDLTEAAGEFGDPTHELKASFHYLRGPFTGFWQTTWVGRTVVANDEPPNFRFPGEIPSSAIHNASFSYQLRDNMQLRLAISNVFDRAPTPLEVAAIGGRSSNEPPTFDIIGRRYTLGFNMSF